MEITMFFQLLKKNLLHFHFITLLCLLCSLFIFECGKQDEETGSVLEENTLTELNDGKTDKVVEDKLSTCKGACSQKGQECVKITIDFWSSKYMCRTFTKDACGGYKVFCHTNCREEFLGATGYQPKKEFSCNNYRCCINIKKIKGCINRYVEPDYCL